ncbi:MAG: hypothetical protein M1836_002490 [Candelina mexicana]|nr:MAG: hypothetical protein M1836_002490 [Candelina mexicana]
MKFASLFAATLLFGTSLAAGPFPRDSTSIAHPQGHLTASEAVEFLRTHGGLHGLTEAQVLEKFTKDPSVLEMFYQDGEETSALAQRADYSQGSGWPESRWVNISVAWIQCIIRQMASLTPTYYARGTLLDLKLYREVGMYVPPKFPSNFLISLFL